jgi:hypothetical protein
VGFDPTLDPSCGVAADGRWPRFEQSFCLAPCSTDGDCRAQYNCVDLGDPTKQSLRGAQVVDQYAGYAPDGGLGFKVCMASTCGDGIKDGTESDVDCGGQSCYACGNALHCGSGSDCLSGTCVAGVCLGDQVCQTNAQCSSGVCNNADPVTGCPPATNCNCAGTNCMDGKQNGAETDVDCGGPDCARCVSTATNALHCLVATDCASGSCVQMEGMGRDCQANNTSTLCVCAPGDCRNGIQDSAETDVDCGGGENGTGCPPCLLDQKCAKSTDCKSNNCLNGKCAPPAVCSVPDAGAPWTPYKPDAGTPDAGNPDAGNLDAGNLDAGDGG